MHESGIGPYGWRNEQDEKRKTFCAPPTRDRGNALVVKARLPASGIGRGGGELERHRGRAGPAGAAAWPVKAAAGWHTDTRFEQPLPAVLRCLFPHLQAPISSMPRPPMGA
jgi:hypothetical protein